MEKNEILMKNNVLIKARYDINTYENKLFILLLYKLQRINETTCKCNLNVDEIRNILKARSVRNKKEISKLLSDLRKRSIYFKNKNNDNWGEFGFINGFVFIEKENSFEIEASEKVYSLLREYLENGYTPINMKIWLGLKSSYAQRFYDLLRLWSNTKTVIEYTIDELRELLMLEDKYIEYRDFKRRVINPAIKELNETEIFKIEVKENKIGRKVNSISFIVQDLDKRVYFNKKEKKNIIEIDIKESNKIVEESNINTDDFYIPNKKLFTAKTLDNFKKDFLNYDFKDSTYKRLLQEAILVALEKDDEEKIKVKSYNYFKKTLENKINDIQNKKDKPKSVNTRFHNINQSFNKYNAEELERMLIESQKSKFEVHSTNSNEDIRADNWRLDENKIG
ncbi:replication initiation protein [Paraclostridium sordellii]|uniref:replication initiation protein n=1 Tax=Paraclostridium sordellii TaxID=1505 RepID=UPI0005E72B81|nr:replication initiation protein [Paeniclostridium sordellii]CEP42317.1 putative replication initiator protein [[Clostridium] sordellii] [Paeniclostridium sordellii]CEP42920.1 putative replication initiator protein [[Clostridium] sordellii] [Paeniclostridium sordellii]